MANTAIQRKEIRQEVLLGLGVMATIFVLIVPLPPFILDLLITLNITAATLVMLITLAAREPLELSTYPTILLLMTLFRLALNVASTRLILLKGQPGDVIQAFGDFVVGGDLVVGIVIFVILIIIQFVVITKGSTRVSEVAARFTLDAMPGKQMAIDADLNSGLITEEQARERREKITSEAEFYGAMDGAGKFVRGDAVAGLIINIVNIVGGVIIGMRNDMPALAALEKYSILTIGDGLVSQTPALIIAVSAGMIVTKTSSKRKFAAEFSDQLLGDARALGIGAMVMASMAIIPGFPKIPFLVIAGALLVLWRRKLAADTQPDEPDQPDTEEEDGPELTPEALGKLLQVDRMGIEIGYRLIQMVDANAKGGLLDHIAMIRRRFATSDGLLVPPIRLKDNLQLDANSYRILISGQEVARGTLYPGHYLAMDPGTATEEVNGIEGRDPTFGLPAVWVRENQRTEAEMKGYTIVDPTSVLVTHLTETIRQNAGEILTREDVQTLIDRTKEVAPAVVKELVPDILSLGEIQGVLQNLLRERIPVKNLPAVLEALADHGRKLKDVDGLTELVRQRLGRTLCAQHADAKGTVHAIVIDPRLESALEQELAGQGATPLSPIAVQRLQETAASLYADGVKRGVEPVVLARAGIRRYVSDLLFGLKPRIPVLSYNELTHAASVEPVGQIGPPAAEPKAAGAVT